MKPVVPLDRASVDGPGSLIALHPRQHIRAGSCDYESFIRSRWEVNCLPTLMLTGILLAAGSPSDSITIGTPEFPSGLPWSSG